MPIQGITELQVANLFYNLVSLSLVFGTIYGVVYRGAQSFMSKHSRVRGGT